MPLIKDMGLDVRKPTNNKGANQPAHSRSLIRAFVILSLDSKITKLATCRVSAIWLLSVAEQPGLSLTLPETLKTGFLASRPI